jgi:hypothetical protein
MIHTLPPHSRLTLQSARSPLLLTALRDIAELWNVAAEEGLVIYMRGSPVYFIPPDDLPERMLDFVLHVLHPSSCSLPVRVLGYEVQMLFRAFGWRGGGVCTECLVD